MGDEEWRDIPGWEGLYVVSDIGRVFSIRRSLVLKAHVTAKGYLAVDLRNGRAKRWHAFVHKLVALAFLGESDQQVNHKDGDKKNNAPDNLEWVSQNENMQHASCMGLLKKPIGEMNPNSKLMGSDVDQILKLISSGWKQKDIAAKFGVAQAHVSAIKLRKCWKNSVDADMYAEAMGRV